jgi:hypothetical protein
MKLFVFHDARPKCIELAYLFSDKFKAVNGIIVDPSGIGIGSILTQSSRSSTSSEEESGCFINAFLF